MLKKDFTKSNKVYFNQNKIPLIILCAFLIIGVLIAGIFGFNGNFEMKGYNEFSVNIQADEAKSYGEYNNTLAQIVNLNGGSFESLSIFGEGDNTQLIVRYLNNVSNTAKQNIDSQVVAKLNVESNAISEHVHVEPVVKARDYVLTVAVILIITAIATIFAYIRYNGASALAILIANVVGSLSLLSFSSILRLRVGLSYFAMLVALNMLIVYFAINLFETIKESSWLHAEDYSTAMEHALNKNKFRVCFVSVAVMIMGLLFVFLASNSLKYVATNLMFVAVVALAMTVYVVPFVWNLFIAQCKKREPKVKASKVETQK